MNTQTLTTHQADPHQRARLKWRARRGLLENDLMLSRFFERYELTMSDEDVLALDCLLQLSDNDLLDLFLTRTEPSADLNTPCIIKILNQIRCTTA